MSASPTPCPTTWPTESSPRSGRTSPWQPSALGLRKPASRRARCRPRERRTRPGGRQLPSLLAAQRPGRGPYQFAGSTWARSLPHSPTDGLRRPVMGVAREITDRLMDAYIAGDRDALVRLYATDAVAETP